MDLKKDNWICTHSYEHDLRGFIRLLILLNSAEMAIHTWNETTEDLDDYPYMGKESDGPCVRWRDVKSAKINKMQPISLKEMEKELKKIIKKRIIKN